MMTEKEAWEFCAKAFSKVVKSQPPLEMYYEAKGFECCSGLCDVIQSHLDCSEKIKDKMLAKIPDSPEGKCFKWPTTKSGAKLRVEFCKRMAKECEG